MPSARLATLPFVLTSDHDVIAAGSVTQTEERRHGVLRPECELMVVQSKPACDIAAAGGGGTASS